MAQILVIIYFLTITFQTMAYYVLVMVVWMVHLAVTTDATTVEVKTDLGAILGTRQTVSHPQLKGRVLFEIW